MKKKTLIEVKFQELSLEVQKDETHEWLLDTESVAQGYGVTAENIRHHKRKRQKELVEGVHFTSVSITNAGLKRSKTLWTKAGVINLGFHINSERAIQFRKWATDLILAVTKTSSNLELKDYFDEKFRDLKNYVDTQNRELKNYVDKKHEDLKQYIHETTFTKQDFANHTPMFAEFMNFVWNTIEAIRKSQQEE